MNASGCNGAGDGSVRLDAGWVRRFASELEPLALRAYLLLAATMSHPASDPSAADLAWVLGLRDRRQLRRVLASLEATGLIEVLQRGTEGDERLHVHLLHLDADGLHRADPVRPTTEEALEFHHRLVDDLHEVARRDETEELRSKFFRKYPPLQEEYELYLANRGEPEDEAVPWRLWMELALYLTSEFERRYGELRRAHADIFKESAAEQVRMQLELVSGITREVLRSKERVFPEVGDGFVVSLPEAPFVAHPLVRKLAERYKVGAEQILLSAVETLGEEGFVVVETDAEGWLADLFLPATTGLDARDEKLLFGTEEDGAGARAPSRLQEVRARYARHLVQRGLEVLVEFIGRGKVRDADAALQRVVEHTNEALELAGSGREDVPPFEPVTLESVIESYDAIRADRVVREPGHVRAGAATKRTKSRSRAAPVR